MSIVLQPIGGAVKLMDRMYVGKNGKFFKYIEMVFDIALVNLGFYIAFMLRFGFEPSAVNIKPFFEMIPIISLAAVVLFYIYGVFSMTKQTMVENIFSIVLSLLFIDLISVVAAFFMREFGFPRSIFIIAFFIQAVLLIGWKLLINVIYQKFNGQKAVLIVGPMDDVEKIARKIIFSKHSLGYVKYLCTNVDKDFFKLIKEVDEVFICASLDNDKKSRIVSYCAGLDKVVYIVPELFEIALIKSQVEQFEDIPVFKIDSLYLSMEDRVAKRMLDFIVSLIGLICLSPVLLIIAASIKLHDRGPVIYTQDRVTRGNKVFKLYKFRSMIVDAEKHTGPVLATDHDPRITPLGRFLRATRLDELPQLFNVLKGEMSLVGPRPERPCFVEQFSEEIPDFKYRVTVKAGVTGLAQVMGKYSTTPDDKLRYDLLYIRNYSFFLDLKIILQTIKILFMKGRSEGVSEDKPLEEIFKELNCKTFEELGATKIDY